MLTALGFVAYAIPLSVIDIRSRRLPNRLTLAAFITVLLLAGVDHSWDAEWRRGLVAAAALVTLYYMGNIISGGGIGMGDVKFAAAVGMWNGSMSWSALFQGTEFAWLAASLIALGLLVARRGSRSGSIPFGPFMTLGAVFAAVLNMP